MEESELFEKLKVSVENQHNELSEIRLKQQTSKQSLDLLNAQNNDSQNQVYKLEKEIAILNIQKEALFQESNRNMADTESKETELNEFNRVITELKEQLDQKKIDYRQTREHEDELERQIQRSDQQIKNQKDLLNQESRMLDSKQNEYNLTKSMIDNLEGFPESIRFLRKNAGWAKQAPLLSDILFCQEECRISIENYLEPFMNHYVVETQAEAAQAIQLLSDSSRGRANFFILEALDNIDKIHRTNIDTEGLIPALNVIDTDEKYRSLCEILLFNVYLLKSSEENELRTALPLDQVVILSKTGMFSKTRNSMSGGSVGLFEGKRIGRAKNLEKLSKEINNGESSIIKLKKSIAEEEKRLNDLVNSSKKDIIQQTQFEINRLENEFTSVKTKQEQYVTFIENSLNRKQDIELKINSIQNLRTSIVRIKEQ